MKGFIQGKYVMNGSTTLADRIVNRSVIGSVHLSALLIFFGAQLLLSPSHGLPPAGAIVLAGLACVARVAEILFAERLPHRSANWRRRIATASIACTLATALMLAILTGESDTHYLGLEVLAILEAAVYLQLVQTLVVAVIASGMSFFWVAYAAHFQFPLPFGEILEASTLALIDLFVAYLVWTLAHMLEEKEIQATQRLRELEETRHQLILHEKLAAVGRLASSVAHEIRNPVAIISSALEIMSSPQFQQEERAEMARIATLEAKRLERLTTEFLDYARPRQISFRSVDVSLLVGYVHDVLKARALQKSVGLDIRIDEPFMVWGDEGQLQQTLLNLIQNAIEASPAGRDIRVSVSRADAGRLSIRIENAGPAIPDSCAEHIFEPFVSARPGGTGLGLAIARTIVEKHHGELALVENKEDHIIFSLIMPLTAAHSKASKEQDDHGAIAHR